MPAPIARIPLLRTPTSDAELRVEIVDNQLLLQVREQQCAEAVEDLPAITAILVPVDKLDGLIAALMEARDSLNSARVVTTRAIPTDGHHANRPR